MEKQMHGHNRFNKILGRPLTIPPAVALVLAVALAPASMGCEPGGGSNGEDEGCPQGMVDCGGLCINPLTDRDHCGAGPDCTLYPGSNCGPGWFCDGTGQCALSCQAGFIDCFGTCTDPNTSRAYCGAGPDCSLNSGTACGAGEICDGSGVCAMACQSHLVECDNVCIDPLMDRNHCGASDDCLGANAGEVCDPGEICNPSGVCVLTCQAGLVDCSGACIDPLINRAHCGVDASCQGGDVCEAGEICEAGSCVLSCQQGLIDCNGTCINPDFDPDYCGAQAGCQGYTDCGANEACVSGHCVSTTP